MEVLQQTFKTIFAMLLLLILLRFSLGFAVYDIETIAGNGVALTTGSDGNIGSAGLNNPVAVWENSAGTVYIVEKNSHCVRQYSTTDSIIHDFAGVCAFFGSSGDGGKATSSLLNGPSGVGGNLQGVVFIADKSNNRVRAVAADGIISTFAGDGGVVFGGDGGQASSSPINSPFGLWVNSLGIVYVVQNSGARVRSIDSSGIIFTLAGML